MEYRHIIFDLDGTLTNPNLGVLNSLRYTLEKMNYEKLPEEVPYSFIGPPLQNSFRDLYGFNEQQVKLAVEFYREYYGKAGLYENEPYAGIHELFEQLVESGYKLYVATSKMEKYARLILEHFELYKYLEDMKGAEYGGNHTKAELIQFLMSKYRMNVEETVMIGDTKFDILGARECEIDSVAVGYGFGRKDELLNLEPTVYVDTVENLTELLVGFY